MIATFKFDTEDIYYPPEYGIDDIPGWLSEIMTECGVTGTFCTMGDKARVMKERGREDVLQAMARHDVVSHQLGNRHPLLIELLADKEWDDGLQAVRDYEDEVAANFQEAFGRGPSGFSKHNIQWGPQHPAVAGERGLPYMSNPVGVPGTEQPCWYAGALTMPNSIMGHPPLEGGSVRHGETITPEFGGFEKIYNNDKAFEKRLEDMRVHVEECAARGVEYISLFGCHPMQVRARGFLEGRCLAGGKNRSVEEVGFLYGLRSREEEEKAKKNFRKLCEFIRDHPALENMGLGEAARAFSYQPSEITRDEMTLYSADVAEKQTIRLHQTCSPAELVTAMAESLTAAGPDGDLPDSVERRNVMGPKDIPTVGLEVHSVTHDQLLGLCRKLVETVRGSGHLPGNLFLEDGGRVGLGQVMVLAARAYLAQTRYDRYSVLNVTGVMRYPDIALNLDARVRRMVLEEGRFDPDLNSEKIAKLARLQTWTLKPAWRNPPQGTPPQGKNSHEGRIWVDGQGS